MLIRRTGGRRAHLSHSAKAAWLDARCWSCPVRRKLALRHWTGQVLSYRELPFEAKETLRLMSDCAPWGYDADECATFFTDAEFALFNVPMEEITAAVLEAGFDDDWNTWDEYHAWYSGRTADGQYPGRSEQGHEILDLSLRPDLWPVNMSGGDELLWDGWHRLHTYYARGEPFVPVLLY